MFEFLTKKYKEKIRILEDRIDNMDYEWSKEREIYTKKTQKRYYEQKVNFVIGGLDITQHTEINRPLYGLTDKDALIVSRMVDEKLSTQGFNSTTSFHWDGSDKCYVIDVRVLSLKI